MPSLFQQVARIAKRGRKRWLGLTFVTQGRAVVSFTSMTRLLMVAIVPSPPHVRMTD